MNIDQRSTEQPAGARRAIAGPVCLGVILLLGLALRVVALDRVPPGLWFDEALNGHDAWAVWQPGGALRLIYPDVFPREPLFETLLALAVKLGGPRVIVLRAVSVAVGMATVLLLYLMLRREAGEAAALAAAAVLATMRWHALLSRLVFRTLVLAPWMVGLVWAALAYRRRPAAWRAALLGIMIGGGFYTYLAWYFMLPLVVGLVVWLSWPWLRGRSATGEAEQRARRHLALIVLAAGLVFAPLGAHYARHPEHLTARPGAVSVFSDGSGKGFREVLENTGEALLMFHWKGDHVAVQNVPHRPALDLLQGVFFVYGLVLCALGLRRREPLAAIFLGWIGCGLLATIFARTDSPNFLRTLGMAPAVAAIVGLGLADAGRRLARRTTPTAAGAAVAALILASAIWTAMDLGAWARRPEVWQRFQAPVVAMADFINDRAPSDAAVFVPEPIWAGRVFQFKAIGASNVYPYADGSILDPWPPSPHAKGQPHPHERWIIVTGGNAINSLRRLVPQGRIQRDFKTPAGEVWAVNYIVPEEDLPPPE